jgi:hypothetical protein
MDERVWVVEKVFVCLCAVMMMCSHSSHLIPSCEAKEAIKQINKVKDHTTYMDTIFPPPAHSHLAI